MNFSDLLSFDIMENREAENRGDNNVENLINDQKNFSQCHCTGPICVCCTDFNMTFIDLGKTCVKIHYISQKEGVNLNLTYGDSSLKTVNSKCHQINFSTGKKCFFPIIYF